MCLSGFRFYGLTEKSYIFTHSKRSMDGLHRIIKSLTKAEKRYFKLFASSFKDDTKLVKLFDVMDALELEDYTDEKATKKSGIAAITSYKTKLRKLVLKAMRNFHEESDDNISLRNGISDIDFLIKKQLVSEAEKEHHKLKKYAEELQAYDILSQLTVLNLQVTEKQKTTEKLKEFYDVLFQETDSYCNQILEQNRATIFRSNVVRYANTFDYENPGLRITIIRKFIEQANSLLDFSKSMMAKVLLYDCLQQCHSQLYEDVKTHEYEDEIYKLYAENPDLKRANWKIYFSTTSNILTSKIYWDEYDSAYLIITQLENDLIEADDYLKNDLMLKFRMKYRLFHSKLAILQKCEQYTNVLDLEQELEYWLTQTEFNIPSAHLQLSLLRFVSALFYAQKLQVAKQWLNRFFMLDVVKQVKVIYYIFRIYEVIVLYDLGDLELSEQKANNLYKILLDSKTDSQFIIHLRVFLLRLHKWDFTKPKDIEECQIWLVDFEKKRETEEEKTGNLFEFIRLGEWLKGKLSL